MRRNFHSTIDGRREFVRGQEVNQTNVLKGEKYPVF